MSDCCKPGPGPARAYCPKSGSPGRPVGHLTLESLLTPPSRALLDTDARYYFCPDATCPVVYFSVERDQTFAMTDVAVPVWQKTPTRLDVPVCYCFQHTPGSIAEELETTGKSTAVETISAKMKAGLCDCERNNPQGSCCLGNVNSVVRATKGSS